jgi:hypothetical protein
MNLKGCWKEQTRLIRRTIAALACRKWGKFQPDSVSTVSVLVDNIIGHFFGDYIKKNSMVWVRERTIPTERLPLWRLHATCKYSNLKTNMRNIYRRDWHNFNTWLQNNYHNSGYYSSSCLLFKTQLYRFVRTSQKTHYVSAMSPTR